jgi:hypothetical protein
MSFIVFLRGYHGEGKQYAHRGVRGKSTTVPSTVTNTGHVNAIVLQAVVVDMRRHDSNGLSAGHGCAARTRVADGTGRYDFVLPGLRRRAIKPSSPVTPGALSVAELAFALFTRFTRLTKL